MGAFNDDLMDAVGLNNKRLIERSAIAQDLQAQNSEAAKRIVSSTVSAADNTLIVKQAQQLAEQKAAQQSQSFATALGTNMDASTEVMTKLAGEWKEATLVSIQKRKELAQDMDVKFLERPGDWIAAQIGMEKTIKTAEVASARRADVGNALTQAQNMTQSVVQTNLALSKVKTDVTLAAELEQARSLLDVDVANAQLKAVSVNRQGIMDLNTMDAQQLANLHTSESIKNSRENMTMARKQFDLNRQSTMLNMQVTQERLEQNKMEKQELVDLAQTIRTGAAVLNNDLSGLPDTKVLQMLKLLPETKEYLRIGMQTNSWGLPVVSSNAGESAKIIMDTQAPMRPEQKDIKNLLTSSFMEATRNPQALGVDNKPINHDVTKMDSVISAANQIAVGKAMRNMADIKPTDGTNIYKAPSLPEIFAIPAVQNTEFGQKVLAPQMAGGGLKELIPSQLISMTVAAIKNKTVSYADAVSGGNAVFHAVPTYNNRTLNYPGLGLPFQEGYKTDVVNPNWNTHEVVNLADAKEFKRIIDRELARTLTQKQSYRMAGAN